ncbi:MAG: hypothetical protein ABWZ98_07710 [Nakamurella sp.]
MAARNGIPTRISVAEVDRLDQDPPPWLAQSRANRTGRKPVWVALSCVVCGYSEMARPKKWWPEFSFVSCEDHDEADFPVLRPGWVRGRYEGIGTRFVGVLDEQV